MATASESVYQGREGSGEAQIYRPFVDPYGAFVAGQEQRDANRALQQEKLALQQQQKRNADIEKYINTNIKSNPGWFQQEDSVAELNDVRSKMEKSAFEDQGIDAQSLAVKFGDDRSNVLRRIGKRKEIQKEIEQIRTGMTSPNSMLDNNWVTTQANKVYDQDVDQVDPGTVVGLQNHPRAFDAEKSIVNSVKGIANQSSYTGAGEPQDIGWGIQINGHSKKVRFKTDAKGRIGDETVDFVLDTDPKISQRLRWDYARQMAGVSDDTFASPEQMKKVQDNFQRIQFSDSPEIVGYVRGKVRQGLNQLQRFEYVDRVKVQNKPKAGSGDPTQDDVNNRLIKINAIKNALTEHGSGAQIPTKVQNYIAELSGVAKYNGMPVTKIELIPGEIRKDGRGDDFTSDAKLRLTLKSGTEGGDILESEPIEVSVKDPRFEEIVNNLYNSTYNLTKEKKITGDLLRGENQFLDEDDEEGGFLD